MCVQPDLLGYIDPNTSQHVFSLLGPILAFLGALGGVLVSGLVFLRHRIATYFAEASGIKRITTMLVVIGVLAAVCAVAWRLVQ